MKVLTVRQPWAWALVHGGKDVENRTWLTRYRGPVAVHASRTIDSQGFYEPTMIDAGARSATIQLGAVLGVVDLTGAHRDRPGCCTSPWAQPHQVHLAVANPRPLTEPVPMRGTLGLRDLPDDLEALVTAQLQAAGQ